MICPFDREDRTSGDEVVVRDGLISSNKEIQSWK
jgi:hypothetical protein